VAKIACGWLLHKDPEEYGWVTERWHACTPPQIERGPVIPLAFRNSLFTQLVRDRFELVPSFGLPAFRGLTFDSTVTPRWIHPEFGPVLIAAHSESPAPDDSPSYRPDWWVGWFALPRWLTSLVAAAEEVALIRFWRIQVGDANGRGDQADFDLEVCELP